MIPKELPRYKGVKVKVPGGKKQVQQIFSRFTVIWCNFNGVPFNTTGFFCRVTSLGFSAIAFFDSFGVARFSFIGTPTSRSFRLTTIRISDGQVFRVRFVPRGVAAFCVIG